MNCGTALAAKMAADKGFSLAIPREGEWGIFLDEAKDHSSFKVFIFRVAETVQLVAGSGAVVEIKSMAHLKNHPPTMTVDREFIKTLVEGAVEHHGVYPERFIRHIAECTMIHPNEPTPKASSDPNLGADAASWTIRFLREQLSKAEKDAHDLHEAAREHERSLAKGHFGQADDHMKTCTLCKALAAHRQRVGK